MKFTEQELLAAFSETVLNGGLIDWDYWVNKMAALTAEQASKLLSGLDPDIFESLKARPNTNDPGNLCRHARNIERAALAENRLTDSPLGWLAWANDKKFKVHDGFVIAVEARERAQAERPQSEPPPAPAQPQAAPNATCSASNATEVKPKAKRRTWLDVSSAHIVEVMRAGQYATAKELYRELERKAGPDSPFDKGAGAYRGSLFVREIAQPVSMKTIQNNWDALRELAQI